MKRGGSEIATTTGPEGFLLLRTRIWAPRNALAFSPSYHKMETFTGLSLNGVGEATKRRVSAPTRPNGRKTYRDLIFRDDVDDHKSR